MGFIKIDRELLDSELWLREPFTYGQAWVDLIGMANWADKDKFYRHQHQRVKRGQIVTSQRALAERWKWSRTQVRTYLRNLESAKMITSNRTANWTTITIENYGKYQDAQPTKRPRNSQQVAHEWPTDGPQPNTQEEYIRKQEGKKGGDTPPPTREDVASYISENGLQVDADRFVDYYEAIGWEINGRPIKSWQALCRRWNGTEDYDKQEKKQTDEERRAEVRRLLDIKARGGNIYDTTGS